MGPDAPLTLVLAPPISTNNLFATAKRGEETEGDSEKPKSGKRVSTTKYRRWKGDAAARIALQRPRRFSVPVSITLYVGEVAVGAAFDLDNASKAYLDALVAAGVIKDDSRRWVRSVALEWVPDMRGCVARIEAAGKPAEAEDVRKMVPAGWREALK